MTIQTHPNFKSVVANVQDAGTIDEYVEYAIDNQEKFYKKMPPWEIKDIGGRDKLQKFKIDLEKIDRLYYINYKDEDEPEYDLITTMQYENNNPIYVEMLAKYPRSYDIEGSIYISQHVNSFMKLVLSDNRYDKTLIYKSLREDGIYIDDDDKKSLPTLKFLTHQTIYDNVNILQEDISLMFPRILKDSVNDFIKTKDATKEYYT